MKEEFMFIACQNDTRTAGRKSLPKSISKRLRIFNYPQSKLQELKINCSRIAFNENIKGSLFHKYTNIPNKITSFKY
jgi:protein subunit release factor A